MQIFKNALIITIGPLDPMTENLVLFSNILFLIDLENEQFLNVWFVLWKKKAVAFGGESYIVVPFFCQ